MLTVAMLYGVIIVGGSNRAYPVNAYTYYMLGAANHLSRAR